MISTPRCQELYRNRPNNASRGNRGSDLDKPGTAKDCSIEAGTVKHKSTQKEGRDSEKPGTYQNKMLSQGSQDKKANQTRCGDRPREAWALTKRKLSQSSRDAATASALEMNSISDINGTLISGASKSTKPGISKKEGKEPV